MLFPISYFYFMIGIVNWATLRPGLYSGRS